MKKTSYLFMLFGAIVLSGAVLYLHGDNSVLPSQSGDAEVFFDTTYANPDFDARAALGEEIIQQLNQAGSGAIVAYNGLTNEITIKENDITPHITELEPYIPEGAGVAEDPTLTRGIIGPDEREQIAGSTLSQYPYRTMVYLELTYQVDIPGINQWEHCGVAQDR